MKSVLRNAIKVSVFGCMAVSLAGCWSASDKEKKVTKGDVVLAEIDGKPVITKDEFFKDLAGMIGGMDPSMLPKETLRKAIDDLVMFELSVMAAKKMGLENDKEFTEAYDAQVLRLRKLLLAKIREKKMFDQIEIDEKDIRAEYDKNMLSYEKEQGGVMVSGVSFKNLEKAKLFYAAAKGMNKDDFDSFGKKDKFGKFAQFGRVDSKAVGYGAQAMEKKVKDAALKLSKLPGVDLVTTPKETWVIHVSDKKAPVMFAYEEIKDRIKNQLKVNKFMSERNKLVADLKKEFTVKINEEYFKDEKSAAAPVKEEPKK